MSAPAQAIPRMPWYHMAEIHDTMQKPASAQEFLLLLQQRAAKSRKYALLKAPLKGSDRERFEAHCKLDHIRFEHQGATTYVQLENSRFTFPTTLKELLLPRQFTYDPQKVEQQMQTLYEQLPDNFTISIKTYVSNKQRKEGPWYNRTWIPDLYSAQVIINEESNKFYKS